MARDEAAYAIARTLRAGRAGVVRDAERIGVGLVNRLRLRLSQPGQGRLYTTRFFTGADGKVHPIGRRVPHRASAPGEPPARDTGRLINSIGHVAERTASGAEITVGSSDPVAVWTEFGTHKDNGSGMEARPWLRPTMEQSRDFIGDEWAEGIEGRERAQARRMGGRG